jgi:hypothetical protein
MSSFSIVDKKKVTPKYTVLSVPIFSIPKGGTGWNKFLKPNAFSINNNLNQSVLFTGYLSGTGIFVNVLYNVFVEVKIRFNLHGQTNYTYEILKFSITNIQDLNWHWNIPINFVKTFSAVTPESPEPFGLYDVYIYIEGTNFTSNADDVLYLNATFYHNDNTTDFFSTPAYYNP